MKQPALLKALILIVFLGLAIFAQGAKPVREVKADKAKLWQALLALKDINLFQSGKPDLQAKADKLFNQIIADGKELQDRELLQDLYRVRYIFGNNEGTLVIESPAPFVSFSQEIHSAYFFDKNKKLINKISFTTGWEMIVNSFEIVKEGDLDLPAIRIETTGYGAFAFAGRAIQYYALYDNQIILIRLESNRRSETENLENRNYYGCGTAIGPKAIERTREGWSRLLNSENKIQNLEALIWLAGKHQDTSGLCTEIADRFRLNAEMRKNKDIQKRLQQLSKSPNKWIAEAAMLALAPIEKKAVKKK